MLKLPSTFMGGGPFRPGSKSYANSLTPQLVHGSEWSCVCVCVCAAYVPAMVVCTYRHSGGSCGRWGRMDGWPKPQKTIILIIIIIISIVRQRFGVCFVSFLSLSLTFSTPKTPSFLLKHCPPGNWLQKTTKSGHYQSSLSSSPTNRPKRKNTKHKMMMKKKKKQEEAEKEKVRAH